METQKQVVLKIENLSKYFGKRKVIDNISFETYAGEVFGFLGPNGSGKTTTIKMIMGLLGRDSGDIYINGIDIKKDFEGAMANIGGIVENPEMYNYLTGLQNLRQYKRVRDGITEERLEEVIEIVKLKNRIKDKVKKYSLGMKQRLGIAQAIMHRPKVLIFDEPTNGLDPAGIKELRDILKRMAHEENAGVFVSSHLLSEMELMCDRVAIIVEGKLIDVKTTQELTSTIGGGIIYRFTVSPADKALEILESIGYAGEKAVLSQGFIDVTIESEEEVSKINAALINGGVSLMGASKLEQTLEDIFIKLTAGNSGEKGGGQIA
jgi:ABC-2 type transport system ATP-binding protein